MAVINIEEKKKDNTKQFLTGKTELFIWLD